METGIDLKAVSEAIGHAFQDEELLILALTHSSRANEGDGLVESNERLEFLGDAVLELVVSEELFRRFPEEREGRLTRLRARLVKEPSLAELARELKLCDFVMLGKGEESQGGRERDSLLADAFEAVVGAIFLDGGFPVAKRWVNSVLEDKWPETPDLPKVKDFKTRLQELTQREYKARPVYVLTGMYGPDHEKIYEVRVTLPSGDAFFAEGGSKKKAEQNAARKALDHLTAQMKKRES